MQLLNPRLPCVLDRRIEENDLILDANFMHNGLESKASFENLCIVKSLSRRTSHFSFQYLLIPALLPSTFGRSEHITPPFTIIFTIELRAPDFDYVLKSLKQNTFNLFV
jgi:hypothetical protein